MLRNGDPIVNLGKPVVMRKAHVFDATRSRLNGSWVCRRERSIACVIQMTEASVVPLRSQTDQWRERGAYSSGGCSLDGIHAVDSEHQQSTRQRAAAAGSVEWRGTEFQAWMVVGTYRKVPKESAAGVRRSTLVIKAQTVLSILAMTGSLSYLENEVSIPSLDPRDLNPFLPLRPAHTKFRKKKAVSLPQLSRISTPRTTTSTQTTTYLLLVNPERKPQQWRTTRARSSICEKSPSPYRTIPRNSRARDEIERRKLSREKRDYTKNSISRVPC